MQNAPNTEKKRRLHFTTRWLFAVTTLVAAVTAFAANYPRVALLVGFVCAYVLVEISLSATVGSNLRRFSMALRVALVMVGTFMLLAAAAIYSYRGLDALVQVRNLLSGGAFCYAMAALLAALRPNRGPDRS